MNGRLRTLAATVLVLGLLAVPALAAAQTGDTVTYLAAETDGGSGGVSYFSATVNNDNLGETDTEVDGAVGACYFSVSTGSLPLSLQTNAAGAVQIAGQFAAGAFASSCSNSSLSFNVTYAPVWLYHGVVNFNQVMGPTPPTGYQKGQVWSAPFANPSGTVCLDATCYALAGGSSTYQFYTTRFPPN